MSHQLKHIAATSLVEFDALIEKFSASLTGQKIVHIEYRVTSRDTYTTIYSALITYCY